MASATPSRTDAGWSACESVIRGFESAWRGGRPARLEDHLPPDPPSALVVELVHVDLEFRLRAGDDARAEDYLGRFPVLADKGHALELIRAEFSLRRRHGRPLPAEEFRRRFPDYDTDLRALLTADGRPPGLSLTHPADPGPGPSTGVPTIPGYQLLGEVGRGGMGVVYSALDLILHRTVAIKTFGGVPGAEAAARFAREAEAIARLDHPHIVPVYEVGEWASPHGGAAVPFFVMKWYPGGSLDGAPAGRGTDPRDHARAVSTIARAVHHAHQRGVLHRDLKPSNILLDEGGGPHVADFGLAGRFDPAGGADHSRTAAVVGTPAYMAPEQARTPRQVTTAADVYGLGAVLYHRLTGVAPFKAETPLATLDQVATLPPARPSAANPTVPRDLETVCLKCLEKDPGRRYASAAELADDLDRFVLGRPVHARPARVWEHAWRWAWCHPVAAGMGVVTLAALVLAGATLWLSYDRIQHEKEEATDAGIREQLARRKLEAALSREKQLLYLERVASAGRLVADNRLPQAWRLLDQCPERLREWEWRYLDALRQAGPVVLTGHAERASAAAFLPDGRLATGDHTGEVRVWDAAGGPAVRAWKAGAGPVAELAAHPSRSWVAAAVGGSGEVVVWDADTGTEVRRLPGAGRLAFSPCGRWAAAAEGSAVRLWDLPGWEVRRQPLPHDGAVTAVAFTPDGSRLLTGSADGTIRGWSPAAGLPVGAVWKRPRPVLGLTFTADGATLIESHREGAVTVDPATGRHVHRVTPTADGRTFAAAARVPGWVGVAGPNNEVIVWDLGRRQPARVFRGHTAPVAAVAFSPDGKLVASAGADRTVRVWPLDREPGVRTLAEPGAWAGGVAVSADGTRAAVGPRCGGSPADDRVLILDTANRKELRRLPAAGGVAFLPGGRRLAAGRPGGGLTVWDTDTGAKVWERPADGPPAGGPTGCRLAVSMDGSRVAGWDVRGGAVQVRNAADGSAVGLIDPGGEHVYALDLSPDGRKLAVVTRSGLTLWDCASRKAIPADRGRGATAVAFSPDGGLLATADDDRVIRLRAAADGKVVRAFDGGAARINALAFRLDGSRLVTGGSDDAARVWDVETGHELLSLPGVRGPVAAVAWDRAADRVLALDDDGLRGWSPDGSW